MGEKSGLGLGSGADQGDRRARAERTRKGKTSLPVSHDGRSPLAPLDLPPHEFRPELPLRSEKIVPATYTTGFFGL